MVFQGQIMFYAILYWFYKTDKTSGHMDSLTFGGWKYFHVYGVGDKFTPTKQSWFNPTKKLLFGVKNEN